MVPEVNPAPSLSRPHVSGVSTDPVPTSFSVSARIRTRAARLSALTGLVRFGLVGMSGMVVNLAVLAGLLHLASGMSPTTSQAVAETVATQVAIVWNFALTETWVFGRTHSAGGRLGRLVGFWSVSMAALAVQLPLGHLLDVALPFGYVVATCAALLVLVGVRFVVCRALLYRGSSTGGSGWLR